MTVLKMRFYREELGMDRRMGEEELLTVKVLIPFSESLKITLRMFVSAKKCIQSTAGHLRAAIPDKNGL